MNIKKKVFSSVLWTAVGNGAGIVVRFLGMAVLARLISPEEFGKWSAILIIVTINERLTTNALYDIVIKYKNEDKDWYGTVFTFSFLLSFFLFWLNILLSEFIAGFFEIEGLGTLLKVSAGVVFLKGLMVSANAYLAKNLSFKSINLIEISGQILGQTITSIVLAYYFDMGAYSMVIGLIVHMLYMLVVFEIKATIPRKVILRMDYVKTILRNIPNLYQSSITSFFANNGDNLIVGKYLGASALGFYGRAYNIMKLPTVTLGFAINRVTYPIMSKLDDDEKIKKGLFLALWLISFIIIPVSMFSILYGEELVLLILGPNWLNAVIPLKLLASGMYFRLAYKVTSSVIMSKGKFNYLAYSNTLYAVLILIGAYIGHYYGLNGVALSTLFGILVFFSTTIYFVNRLIGVSFYKMVFLHVRIIVITLLLCGVNLVIKDLLNDSSIILKLIIGVLLNFMLLSSLFFTKNSILLGKEGIWWTEEILRMMQKVKKK